jgi:hypothetical protein
MLSGLRLPPHPGGSCEQFLYLIKDKPRVISKDMLAL